MLGVYRSRIQWRAVIAAILIALAGAAAAAERPAPAESSAVPGELLVGFRGGVGPEAAEQLYVPLGATRLERLPQINVHRIRVPADKQDALAARLRQSPLVEFVELNRISGVRMSSLQTVVPDEIMVGIDPSAPEGAAENAYREIGGARLRGLRQSNVHQVRVPAALVPSVGAALSGQPGIRFVEPHYIAHPALVPSDTSFGQQWHLPKISAPAAWDVTAGAREIVIAIVDTGVDPTHPDLAAQLVPGYNFYSSNTNTADVQGHGTLVAGAAAAIGNNTVGVAGVAWRSRIMPLRVADSTGSAQTSRIASAITWAADHGARVVNVSFAGIAGSYTVTSAAQYANSKGAVVVAAAGNCGCVESTPENPSVISVSATDSSDNLAWFSSRGLYVDVGAPGVGILTTSWGGGYASASGTSMSSPVAAGVAALILSANPLLKPADVTTILRTNADDLGTSGWDASFGFGRINAWRAVQAALGTTSTPPPPSPDITPPPMVGNFAATDPQTGSRLDLTWTTPSPDIAGTLLLRRAGAPVTDVPVAGRTYARGATLGASTVVFAASGTAVGDTGLTTGTTYYYRAFAFDTTYNYSTGAGAQGTPTQKASGCPAEVIVDNLAAGSQSSLVSFTGTWSSSAAAGAYGKNASLYSTGAALDTYTWRTAAFSSSQTCAYDVYVWWTADSHRSSSVPFTVLGHGGAPRTMLVDQRTGGGQWQIHGRYSFPAGAAGAVTVSDQHGQASADAVRFVLTTSTATATASGVTTVIMDTDAGGARASGSWCRSDAPNPYGGGSLYSCGGAADTYRWTPNLASAGTYAVYVWWTSHPNRSTRVPITVDHAAGATTRTFNEQAGGGTWQLHGRYTFSAGALGSIQVSDANGQAAADAVGFVAEP